jgi:drug/metabolite transporter (DMT)-like permease
VGAFFCYNFALTQVPASRAAVFVNGIPVVTAMGAWALLNERLNGIQAGGGALVLAAVFIANLPMGALRRHLPLKKSIRP